MSSSLMMVIVLVVIGALLRAAGLLTKSHADRLAGLVFSVSLPATILVSLDRMVFAPRTWTLPAAACLITLPLLACAWLIARRLDLPRPRQGAFLLATGCINSVYFAYPVVSALFGAEGLARAILFDLGQTLLTLTGLLWPGGVAWSPDGVAACGGQASVDCSSALGVGRHPLIERIPPPAAGVAS
jgi:malate permease and related proteins